MTALVDKPARKVQRMIRSKIEIISSTDRAVIENDYEILVNHILSYGGRINGCKYSTSSAIMERDFYETFSVCVFYEVPINVTDEILKPAYEKMESD